MKITKNENLRIGICLSGGGALGFAHLGALQALNERNVFPAEVSGASMGAIIGCLYAAGYTPAQILSILRKEKMYRTPRILSLKWKPIWETSGISTHKKLRTVLRKYIPKNSFENLKLPFHICATNFNSGTCEIISSGADLDKWVAASASIPSVFETIQINGNYYSDGGITNNLPVQPLTKTCDFIIGIDVTPYIPTDKELNSVLGAGILASHLSLKNTAAAGKALCNILIESKAAEKFNDFDFRHYEEIYKYGYDAVNEWFDANENFEVNK